MARKDNLDVSLLEHCDFGQARDVVSLLKQGANKDAIDANGYSALMVAAGNESVDCVNVLIEAGASVDYVSKTDGCTALMIAANYGNSDSVKSLLNAGADADIVNHEGDTASMIAETLEHENYIALFMTHDLTRSKPKPAQSPGLGGNAEPV